MKITSYILTGTCIAALTLLVPINASAQGTKTKASPSPSPAAAEASTTTTTKAASTARAIPLRGTASAVDKSAKTFTVAGKTTSRVFKATDTTTVTKDGAAATFADLADNDYVTGSYWKKDDGTLELKSLKIGGKTEAEKASSASKKTKKKSKKDDAAAEDEEPTEE